MSYVPAMYYEIVNQQGHNDQRQRTDDNAMWNSFKYGKT